MNNTRLSGRTFRILLGALQRLSEGRDVVLIAHDRKQSAELFSKAVGVLEGYIPLNQLEIASRHQHVRIIGCKGSLVVVDHQTLSGYKEHRHKYQFIRDHDQNETNNYE